MGKRAESPSELPKTYRPCRAFRHEPRFVTDHAVFAGKQVIEFSRVTECNVCKTRITTTYSVPDFRVKKRKYDYPEKYQIKGGYSVFDARADYIMDRNAG